MKSSTLIFIVAALLAVYGMFGIIHADNTKNAAFGNFLDTSGKISLGVAFLIGLAAYALRKPTGRR
jgi:hypothetical protein